VETNVWVTDRTFIGMGRRPVRENILHLLDYDSTGLYTLIYEALPAADEIPPSSHVAALPADSYRRIAVNWSGQDNPGGSGIAGYDVFVSANGGDFTNWLQRTTLNGSVYFGEVGHSYAFYSVAVDKAGNREAAPTTPDASTTVTLTNRAPVPLLATNWFSIPEGSEFTLQLAATDADAADALEFSLADAPAGMTISRATGLIRWATGEGNGPTTNQIVARVQDNGDPPLSASAAFTLVVREVNTRPTLAAIADRTINEGFLLMITNAASDSDLPPNRLTFTLGADAPPGAAINPTNGVFRWQPTETQGPSTNRLTVIVTDDGPPPLSATQFFTVVVRDTLSDFLVASGSTNVLTNAWASVPLGLRTGEELSGVSFLLELAEARMTNLALHSSAASVTWQREAPDVYRVSVQSSGGQALQGDLPSLLQLDFQAVPHPRSAVVPVKVQSVEGTSAGGARRLNGQGQSGRVFILGAEPILDAFLRTNGTRTLVLYGHAGRDYLIERATNLTAEIPWTPWRQVHLEGAFAVEENAEVIGPNIFYRAVELAATGLRLSIWRDGTDTLLEWPVEAGECAVEETASLVPPVQWTPASGTPQRSGDRFRLLRPLGTGARFYRLACQLPGR
jgi:hypothetical protein